MKTFQVLAQAHTQASPVYATGMTASKYHSLPQTGYHSHPYIQ